MTDDLIRYDVLTQEALRDVIRKVLEEVEKAGLPGEHHFFITFDTNAPGVRLSTRMRERYPETMTIVIQHSYWDLEAGETAFEVDLSFNDIRERLRIPYTAIQAFFDPSVKFGLQFEVALEEHGFPDEDDVRLEEQDNLEGTGPSSATAASGGSAEDDGAKSGEVVSLDSFRKKK
jgi:hypothetical protein